MIVKFINDISELIVMQVSLVTFDFDVKDDKGTSTTGISLIDTNSKLVYVIPAVRTQANLFIEELYEKGRVDLTMLGTARLCGHCS